MGQRLYRSSTDRMMTGVCGGMAEYSDLDPVLVRLLWVLAAIFSGGMAIIVYAVMAVITPSAARSGAGFEAPAAPAGTAGDTATPMPPDAAASPETADDATPPATSEAAAPAETADDAATPAPLDPAASDTEPSAGASPPAAPAEPQPRASAPAPARRWKSGSIFGVILVVVGGIALIDSLGMFAFFNPWNLWPLILIGIGAAVIYSRRS